MSGGESLSVLTLVIPCNYSNGPQRVFQYSEVSEVETVKPDILVCCFDVIKLNQIFQ